jgi:hypothetical protein
MQEEQEDVITTVQIQGNDMQILKEKASIDIQVSTAKAFPRDIRRATENSLYTATMDVETAETCTYAVPRGDKSITGPSVYLARILMQNWGNLRGESKVTEEGQTTVTSEAIVWDLENNFAIKCTVKRSIMTKNGRMNADMITVTGNAANAIALRNAAFNVIPRAITDKVYKAVQDKIIGDEEKFDKRLKDVLAGFKKVYDKDEKEVIALVGKKELDQITKGDLVVLVGVARTLKDGEVNADLVFKVNKTGADKKADLKAKQAEAKKDDAPAANENTAETPAADQATVETKAPEVKKESILGGEQGKIVLP